ncbi:TrkA family potassium uptake protein [bacterium]|nr:TrkA family potassium uptake protein [bacterium]
MQFVVIGLGSFGTHVATGLSERGCQVLAIDSNKEKIQNIKDVVAQSIVMDARDREALLALPIQATDTAIISLGDQMELSILVTLYLKEMGLEKILVKAISEDHGKILRMIGASEVIYPEKQMAYRLADRLAHPKVLDYISLADGFSMAELVPLDSFYGKSLKELELRNKFGLEVIAVKTTTIDSTGESIEKLKHIPSAEYRIEEGDVLVVVGADKYIEKYRKY